MSSEESRLVRAADWASRAGSLSPEDPVLRRGLHIAIGLVVVLGVGLTIVASLNDFPDIDWRWKPGWLALGVLGYAAFQLCNAELWRRLLRALGPSLAPLPATATWFTSWLARLVPTSLLMPMMRMALAEREGVPKRICLVSIAYEIALALTGGLIVAAYFIIDLPDLEGHWQRFAVLAIPVCALIGLQPRFFHRFTDYVLARLGRETLPQSLGSARVFEFAALYALVYVLSGLSTFALAQCIYPLGADDLITVIGAFAVGITIGVVAFFLPGGLVAREAGIAVALTPIMPTAPAVAIAILSRVVQIAVEVVIATVSQVLMRRSRPYSERALSGTAS